MIIQVENCQLEIAHIGTEQEIALEILGEQIKEAASWAARAIKAFLDDLARGFQRIIDGMQLLIRARQKMAYDHPA